MAENRQQQEIKEITDNVEQGVKELFESEKYKVFLHTMSKFHNYSLNNTMLIAMQMPEATLVAGYEAWKKNHERPNRIVEINWRQRKLNRVIDKYSTNLHHIMWQCNKHLYNVNIPENKIIMSEREHIALNNYFWNKQNPR